MDLGLGESVAGDWELTLTCGSIAQALFPTQGFRESGGVRICKANLDSGFAVDAFGIQRGRKLTVCVTKTRSRRRCFRVRRRREASFRGYCIVPLVY